MLKSFKKGDLVRYTISEETKDSIYEVVGDPYETPEGVTLVPIIRPVYPHNKSGFAWGGIVTLNHLEKICEENLTDF